MPGPNSAICRRHKSPRCAQYREWHYGNLEPGQPDFVGRVHFKCRAAAASHLIGQATNIYKSHASIDVLVAPNVNWGGSQNGPEGSNGNVYPVSLYATIPQHQFFRMMLEGSTVAVAIDGAGGAVSALGWDNNTI